MQDIWLTVLEIECLQEADQVSGRSTQDQDVEYLVRATPNVELARRQPFRDSSLVGSHHEWTSCESGGEAYSIDSRTGDVEEPVQYEPVECNPFTELLDPIESEPANDWKYR